MVSGCIEVVRARGDSHELIPFDALGASTLLDGRRSGVTIRAAEPSTVLLLSREAFLGLVRSRPWLGVPLLERLGRRLAEELTCALDPAQRDPCDETGALRSPGGSSLKL